MIDFSVDQLADITGAHLWTKDSPAYCTHVVIDSREVRPGSLFVAFVGVHVDGNDYAFEALDAQASAVLLTRDPDEGLIRHAHAHRAALLSTNDPEECLLRLASAYRQSLDCCVIGITGSIGKTTTKDLLAGLLSSHFRVCATKGNYNNLIGLPLTVLSAPPDTQVLVLEMGMDGPGQIERLSRAVKPNLAIITKIGNSHVGLLGGREQIARAKAEIISYMQGGNTPFGASFDPVVLLSSDDDFTPFIEAQFAAPAGVKCLLCGSGESDAVRVFHSSLDEHGHAEFSFSFPYDDTATYSSSLGILGTQAISNALFALGAAHLLGVDSMLLADTLPTLEVTGQRLELRHRADGLSILDDSYNASPESMAAALDLVKRLSGDRRSVAVLGEMGELGEQMEAQLHAAVGAYAAAQKLDFLVFVGGQAALTMSEAARTMGQPRDALIYAKDVSSLCMDLLPRLSSHDFVLVKGSHFVGLDRFVKEVCDDAR